MELTSIVQPTAKGLAPIINQKCKIPIPCFVLEDIITVKITLGVVGIGLQKKFCQNSIQLVSSIHSRPSWAKW